MKVVDSRDPLFFYSYDLVSSILQDLLAWRILLTLVEIELLSVVSLFNVFLNLILQAKYVQEVSPLKVNVMLMNKADFLTEKQRATWADHFKYTVFFVRIQYHGDTEVFSVDFYRESDTYSLFFSATSDEAETLDSEGNITDFNTSKILSPKGNKSSVVWNLPYFFL